MKDAYDAINNAWGAVKDAQATMEAAGIPKPIVELLDAPRLRVSSTAEFPALVEALDDISELAHRYE